MHLFNSKIFIQVQQTQREWFIQLGYYAKLLDSHSRNIKKQDRRKHSKEKYKEIQKLKYTPLVLTLINHCLRNMLYITISIATYCCISTKISKKHKLINSFLTETEFKTKVKKPINTLVQGNTKHT